MSRDGSGNYVPPAGSWYPGVSGASATLTDWQALLSDMSSALTQSVSKDGQTALTGNINAGGFKLSSIGAATTSGDAVRWEQVLGLGANIASAGTVNLTTATGNLVHITGTTTITAVTLGTGLTRNVIFDGALTLTHHATNNNLPGAVNITTAAGDRATYWSDGTTVYCTEYQRANGVGIAGMTLIAPPTILAAPAASVSFSTGFAAGYKRYHLTMVNVQPATDGDALYLRVWQSGSLRAGAADYGYAQGGGSSVPAAYNNGNAATSAIVIAQGLSNVNFARNFGGHIDFYDPTTASFSKPIVAVCGYLSSTPAYLYSTCAGEYVGTTSGSGSAALEGFSLQMSTGNIGAGSAFYLYGMTS